MKIPSTVLESDRCRKKLMELRFIHSFLSIDSPGMSGDVENSGRENI